MLSSFWTNWRTQHLPSVAPKNFLFVLSVVEVSALDLQFVVELSQTKQTSVPHFTTETIFMFLLVFCKYKKDLVLISWKTLVSSCFSSSFFSSFDDSCPFCGRSDTDIGRGSSVASSRFISFLLSFHLPFSKVSSSLIFFKIMCFFVVCFLTSFFLYLFFCHLFVFPTFLSSLFLS